MPQSKIRPRIILASASPQRKALLKQAGIAFTVRPSRAKEQTKLTSTCAALVKHNALIKAQEVASRTKSGIVIGADTLVYSPVSSIIGKPRSMKEAVRILKKLFSHPHWVYTGVAVIGVGTNRTIVGYEKTRVHMQKLSDEEIMAYHRRMHPLDKAGGFDIEGWGSLFIRRIDGCYTNVIGLPMARLRLMLKELGVSLL